MLLTNAVAVNDPGVLVVGECPELDLGILPLHVDLKSHGVSHLDDVNVGEILNPDSQIDDIVILRRSRPSGKWRRKDINKLTELVDSSSSKSLGFKTG